MQTSKTIQLVTYWNSWINQNKYAQLFSPYTVERCCWLFFYSLEIKKEQWRNLYTHRAFSIDFGLLGFFALVRFTWPINTLKTKHQMTNKAPEYLKRIDEKKTVLSKYHPKSVYLLYTNGILFPSTLRPPTSLSSPSSLFRWFHKNSNFIL